MDKKLFFRLQQWRESEAQREHVPPYRILSHRALTEIAQRKPLSRDEFFLISGVKEAKWRRYGTSLVAMVRDFFGEENVATENVSVSVSESSDLVNSFLESADGRGDDPWRDSSQESRESSAPYEVGVFLDILNESFSGMVVSIRGEVSGIEERRGVRYFSLKDAHGDGMISCLMFAREFSLQGVELEDGQEVILEGAPNVWKSRGRLSFVVSVIRASGAGALKHSYDELRLRLEREGVFSDKRKREIPLFPERIALITSRDGAAIGDFSANLDRRGFVVSFFDAQVEGKRAVGNLLEALRFFNASPDRWDVIVLIRGGGSLESLEAYNSEILVRAVAESKIPVLAGIGHEKDVSLVALAADRMVSTPTATARAISESWTSAEIRLNNCLRDIDRGFDYMFTKYGERVRMAENVVFGVVRTLSYRVLSAEKSLHHIFPIFSDWLLRARNHEDTLLQASVFRFALYFSRTLQRLDTLMHLIAFRSPKRLLEQGYALLRKRDHVIRSISNVSAGDAVEILLADGVVRAKINT